jgi:hypothetical protein
MLSAPGLGVLRRPGGFLVHSAGPGVKLLNFPFLTGNLLAATRLLPDYETTSPFSMA